MVIVENTMQFIDTIEIISQVYGEQITIHFLFLRHENYEEGEIL
uniref:Uncharacterized protein n=1 Tax=Anguilla anguilla TaxID=7936 RepID=A0A0E9QY28_ANGAN